MAYEVTDRKALREQALMLHSGSNAQNRYGHMMDTWLNTGQRRMYEGSGIDGIYEEWLLTVASGAYSVPIGDGVVKTLACFINDNSGSRLTKKSLPIVQPRDGSSQRPYLYDVIWQPGGSILVTGPGTCSAAYEILLQGYRTPRPMLQDGATPELPLQFIEAPAYFAAAMASLADHDDSGHAEKLMSLFNQQKAEFQRQLIVNTADTPATVMEYWT